MNIYEKIAAVMQDVQYLAKDDNVSFGQTNYKALSEEKVTVIMRSAMLKHKLVVFPVEQSATRIGNITHVDVKYRIVNIEDPADYIEVVSCGDGADTQDKGSGKAMTYAFKYMWLRTFAIPTGEDPDKISSAQLDEEAKKAITCEDCGKKITAKRFKGTEYSADTIAQNAVEAYGRRLCWDCMKAARAAMETANG
jgi:hypothetical protein